MPGPGATPERMAEVRAIRDAKRAAEKGMTEDELLESHIHIGELAAYPSGGGGTRPKNTWRWRRTLRYMMAMTTEQFDTHKPRNAYERAIKALVGALDKGKEGQVVCQICKELREGLGEKDSADRQSASSKRESEMPKIVNDLPTAVYKANELN